MLCKIIEGNVSRIRDLIDVLDLPHKVLSGNS